MISPHLEPLDGEIDAVRVQVSENDLLLHFPYHKQAVDWVKRIEGAEYHSHDKSWSFVVTEDNTLALRDLVDELREFFRREQEKSELRELRRLDIADDVAARLEAGYGFPGLTIVPREGDVAISFPYSPKAIQIMRKVEGRRWDPDEKAWLLPADAEKQIRSALKALKKALR